ncbi:MAG: pyridoxal phosphate-dependent aminotransferase [Desulfotignum sp.]|nr:pyridoxal phosphate-dependent aminotransferase [Desulfotignum sp.]
MKYTDAIERLDALGGDKWAVYKMARQMMADGKDVIEMAIGEPDVPTPDYLIDAAMAALRAGRTGYAASTGESRLRCALAERYTRQAGREILPEQVLCFPGTQTALYAVISAVAASGDEVILGDPMYATYASVMASTGAGMVHVPLQAANGFRIQAADIEERITAGTSLIFLNTPHNPTGAVLTEQDIAGIGAVAKKHDLWLLVDEVYDEMVFSNAPFFTPLSHPDLADRVIVVSSISKSHAAPGFRSGWCVGPADFCSRLLPMSEAMLFGNQPFIADATIAAVGRPSPVARGMCDRFLRRAQQLEKILHSRTRLTVQKPEAGMFALVNVSCTGMNSKDYAMDLLLNGGVGVMPGSAFGESLHDWVRIALTKPDDIFDEGCKRIAAHAEKNNG